MLVRTLGAIVLTLTLLSCSGLTRASEVKSPDSVVVNVFFVDLDAILAQADKGESRGSDNFRQLALALPPLGREGHDLNNLHNLAVSLPPVGSEKERTFQNLGDVATRQHDSGLPTLLGSMTVDKNDEGPVDGWPWQVGLRSGGEGVEIGLGLTLFLFASSDDDGDLDLYLVNAPGGDNANDDGGDFLNWQRGGGVEIGVGLSIYFLALDDDNGDLDLYLVNAPGGDNANVDGSGSLK